MGCAFAGGWVRARPQFTPAMTTPAWIWEDFGTGSVVTGCCGVAFFVFDVLGMLHLHRSPPADNIRESDQTAFASFSGIVWGLMFVAVTYTKANEHRLLRGECRYTIARVYEHGFTKRHRYARLAFWVSGERYRHDEDIDALRPLPVGSCWFLRYAVPDPDANEFMDIPMPDSVRVVPPTGWARRPPAALPEPPALPPPAAPRVPAAAPEPLTGPAASPVFRPALARPDSTPRPRFGPLAAPPLPGAEPAPRPAPDGYL